MWKWLFSIIIVILTGWVMLRSNRLMNRAEDAIEQTLFQLEKAYYEKYDIYSNLSNSVKTYANINSAFKDRLEYARGNVVKVSISRLTSTPKGPFQFAKVQAQLDLVVAETRDSISLRNEMSEDANFKVLLKDFDMVTEKCQTYSLIYNKEVDRYNSVLTVFPNNFLSRIFGYKKRYSLNIPDQAT